MGRPDGEQEFDFVDGCRSVGDVMVQLQRINNRLDAQYLCSWTTSVIVIIFTMNGDYSRSNNTVM